MIADDVAKMIYAIRYESFRKEEREPIVVVYMEMNLWFSMMNELHDKLSPQAYEVYSSQGRKISGCDIYRVVSEGHGIKVLKVGEI
ncbi:MAG: hypothetical protein EPN94_10940 [Nitrospirae bacterium]|nr:MAG: hypothetical protein EPN94_10940 [Nitrospirota bacterium]